MSAPHFWHLVRPCSVFAPQRSKDMVINSFFAISDSNTDHLRSRILRNNNKREGDRYKEEN
jgi:hypothetical protein